MARAEGAPAFTMNQLAAFVAVAEAGTISGAAERLRRGARSHPSGALGLTPGLDALEAPTLDLHDDAPPREGCIT